VINRQGRQLLFNPGSPTDKRRQKLFSFGMLEIAGKEIRAKHVFYTSKT
jgi:predicted phosphodiesterase